eukprot:c39154_g1_i1 orf=1-246(-)
MCGHIKHPKYISTCLVYKSLTSKNDCIINMLAFLCLKVQAGSLDVAPCSQKELSLAFTQEGCAITSLSSLYLDKQWCLIQRN